MFRRLHVVLKLYSREGMEKMVDVYRQNPSVGDPDTIEQQLAENAKELDTLNVDLHKYQVRYKKGLRCVLSLLATQR